MTKAEKIQRIAHTRTTKAEIGDHEHDTDKTHYVLIAESQNQTPYAHIESELHDLSHDILNETLKVANNSYDVHRCRGICGGVDQNYILQPKPTLPRTHRTNIHYHLIIRFGHKKIVHPLTIFSYPSYNRKTQTSSMMYRFMTHKSSSLTECIKLLHTILNTFNNMSEQNITTYSFTQQKYIHTVVKRKIKTRLVRVNNCKNCIIDPVVKTRILNSKTESVKPITYIPIEQLDAENTLSINYVQKILKTNGQTGSRQTARATHATITGQTAQDLYDEKWRGVLITQKITQWERYTQPKSILTKPKPAEIVCIKQVTIDLTGKTHYEFGIGKYDLTIKPAPAPAPHAPRIHQRFQRTPKPPTQTDNTNRQWLTPQQKLETLSNIMGYPLHQTQTHTTPQDILR